MSDKLCIIPCGLTKIWDKNPQAGPTKAQYVYTGVFAAACQRYAKTFFKDWVILSAKYGFLLPNDVVEGPYNVTFNKPSERTITVESLRVQAQSKGLFNFNEIVVLGGSNYVERAYIVFNNGQNIVTPLSDCGGIGYMLQKLSHALAEEREIDISMGLQPKASKKTDNPIQEHSRKKQSVFQNVGKYAALYDYLCSQHANILSLTFKEIESILGFTLPASARQHRPWWANSHIHSQANSWLNAGWEVAQLNMPNSVSFSKAK